MFYSENDKLLISYENRNIESESASFVAWKYRFARFWTIYKWKLENLEEVWEGELAETSPFTQTIVSSGPATNSLQSLIC